MFLPYFGHESRTSYSMKPNRKFMHVVKFLHSDSYLFRIKRSVEWREIKDSKNQTRLIAWVVFAVFPTLSKKIDQKISIANCNRWQFIMNSSDLDRRSLKQKPHICPFHFSLISTPKCTARRKGIKNSLAVKENTQKTINFNKRTCLVRASREEEAKKESDGSQTHSHWNLECSNTCSGAPNLLHFLPRPFIPPDVFHQMISI